MSVAEILSLVVIALVVALWRVGDADRTRRRHRLTQAQYERRAAADDAAAERSAPPVPPGAVQARLSEIGERGLQLDFTAGPRFGERTSGSGR